MKKAFTMVELIFVIIVIGILSAVAVPKLAPIVSNANEAKGKATLSSVRSAIATERQKQILKGTFSGITSLRGNGKGIFSTFNDENGTRVLEYDVEPCTHNGCWIIDSVGTRGVDYIYKTSSGDCKFKLENNRFIDKTNNGCKVLK